jgi:putative ABC transport system permease protein
MQPMTDMRLRTTAVDGNIEATGDIAYVYLLFCSFHFYHRHCLYQFYEPCHCSDRLVRAKEVGIGKQLAPKKRLVMQFLLESVIISAISMILAIGVLYVALPFFQSNY